jgi:hypothetical protein
MSLLEKISDLYNFLEKSNESREEGTCMIFSTQVFEVI